jgi:hypothetical protein
MAKRYVVKSCCGKQSYIFQIDKPIKKNHLPTFEGAGYTAPLNFKNHGIFYIRGFGIIATCSFGTNRVNVRCSGADCPSKLDEFEKLLHKAVTS